MSLYFNHSIIWYNNYNPYTNNKLIIVYIIIAEWNKIKISRKTRARAENKSRKNYFWFCPADWCLLVNMYTCVQKAVLTL